MPNITRGQKCYDAEFLIKLFEQLDDLLREAYYSTPPHISSKSLVKRARDIVRSILIDLYSSD